MCYLHSAATHPTFTTGNTPSQKYPTRPTTVIITIAVAIIMTLLVIITILSVLLVLRNKKQPRTVQCDKVNMSEIYEVVDDIVKTNQDYEGVDVSKMDDDVMNSKDYQKLNVRKVDSLDDEVMIKAILDWITEDYNELDTEKMDETTQYALLE